MFSFFKRKPSTNMKKTTNKKLNNKRQTSSTILATPKYKFDIEVYEMDDASVPPEKFYDVFADSAEALKALYATCKQNVKILKQTPLDDDVDVTVKNKTETNDYDESDDYDESGEYENQVNSENTCQPTSSDKSNIDNVTITKVEPKYVTVSGIKMKIVGDDVYQKQWIRASEEESAGIRLIVDKTNKLVNLEGKHFELEKWVQIVEDKQND